MKRHRSRAPRRRLLAESLETRTLLAGDVAVGIGFDGTLSIVGDDADNGISIVTDHRKVPDSQTVTGGTTSVTLDTDLLAAAANLVLSSVANTSPPAPGFAVGFPILPSSDLELSSKAEIPPVGGIEHVGQVLFNNDTIIVGDFTVGFDATRAVGNASGFFVADTVSGLGVLFDVGSPALDITPTTLTVSDADLLVSPEFAATLLSLGLAAADLTGADVGDVQVDATLALLQQRQVDGGTTSVDLDTDLIEAAAGLVLTDVNGSATPAPGFDVGFRILAKSSFAFAASEKFAPLGFQPQGGVIEHKGTLTFNDSITVGNFDIGYDPARAQGAASGFFIESTTGLEGILFDVGLPGLVDYSDSELTVGQVDLLISPEFASILGNAALSGADVGDAQIDAELRAAMAPYIQISGLYSRYRPTLVNGQHSAAVPVEALQSISVRVGGGNDTVRIYRLAAPGDLEIDLGDGHRNSLSISRAHIDGTTRIEGGSGRDSISIYHSQFADLEVDTGGGNDWFQLVSSVIANLDIETDAGHDHVNLYYNRVQGDARVSLGNGSDRLFVFGTRVSGAAEFDGGAGAYDWSLSLQSRYGSLTRTNFRR